MERENESVGQLGKNIPLLITIAYTLNSDLILLE